MAQLFVRNIDEDLKERLRRRARSRGQSLDATVRDILRDAVADVPDADAGPLGTRMAAEFRSIGLAEDLTEFRGTPVRPMDLDECRRE
ncbi:hypothetical protein STAQ_43770 [Allostella sp. ATCC 35155]|nr:hypothetical protein STAQ_43770 [Stella sp. ATCC 35155]